MSDMKLQMIVTGNNSGLNKVLNDSDAHVRKFTSSAASHFTKFQAHATKVWSAINGASAATKLIGIGAGVGGFKSMLDDNLAFERSLLKIKFNAGMTTKELAELRKMAMDISKTSLNSPLDVVQMQLRLANAGLKMQDIRQLAPTVANAAQVFEAPAGEIADLVFDKITKSGIKNERVPQMLDMLYFHATSGRFETMDMARQAPELLNAGAGVGLNNEAGLNLMGAMTQRMMRNATVQNPSEVATLVKHGLSHITDPHYIKGLAKAGIDVPSYFDNKGHFKGDGGVDGIIALTKAMKAAGLDNPFKMGQAGFKEQYTKTFWLEMMRSLDAKDTDKDPNLINMMERGKEAMNSGQLATNLAVIKEANFGKIKAAEIEIQKAKLSTGAQTATGAAGSVAGMFSDHPIATTGAAVGGVLAGKYLLNKLLGSKGGALAQAMGAGGTGMPVTVTNWPAGFGGPTKASERMANVVKNVGTTAVGAGVGTSVASGILATVVSGTAMVAAPGAVAYAAKKYFDSDVGQKNRSKRLDLEIQRLETRLGGQKGSGYQDKQLIAQLERQLNQMKSDRDAILSKLDAVANRPVEVHLDGQKVAESVNKINGRDARRQ